ncbi:hypothetical protein [Nonlabens ulvanivorans]|uniref:Uncharacterized protein n=1 Tax=Nonlabens ulvanivorans TaxID=906888 RepID=A0A084JTW8_NONUL|nr:hypothetical protein [Nonlabens ulvanivorans]KEZ92402.1 hypothetical protein IL45_09630 [Nonlabens ulvanivorans]PRX15236.1 hypothetical protein LY02_00451 [Nonlabens ulvanivorans]
MKFFFKCVLIFISTFGYSQNEYYEKSHELVEKIHEYGRAFTYIPDKFDLAEKSIAFKNDSCFDELILKLMLSPKRRVDSISDNSIYEKRDSITLNHLSLKSNWTVLDYDEELTPKFWNPDLMQYVKTVKEVDFKWRTSNYSIVGAVLFNDNFSIVCMGTKRFYWCRVFELVDDKWVLQMGHTSPTGLGKE